MDTFAKIHMTKRNEKHPMQHETQLKTLLTQDPVRMKILRMARELNLPDCWIGAGFVRSLVWDHLHQRCPQTSMSSGSTRHVPVRKPIRRWKAHSRASAVK